MTNVVVGINNKAYKGIVGKELLTDDKKMAPIGGWPNLLSGPENLCFLSFYNIYQPNKAAGPKNSRIPGGGYKVVPKVGTVKPSSSAAIIFGGRG